MQKYLHSLVPLSFAQIYPNKKTTWLRYHFPLLSLSSTKHLPKLSFLTHYLNSRHRCNTSRPMIASSINGMWRGLLFYFYNLLSYNMLCYVMLCCMLCFALLYFVLFKWIKLIVVSGAGQQWKQRYLTILRASTTEKNTDSFPLLLPLLVRYKHSLPTSLFCLFICIIIFIFIFIFIFMVIYL